MSQADLDYTRQIDLCNPDLLAELRIEQVGAGAVGGLTAMFFASIGVGDLHVRDNDIVEDHNVANQLIYPPELVGQPKVNVLYAMTGLLTGGTITIHKEPFTDQEVRGVVVSTVDSMAARQLIWQAVKRDREQVSLFVDSRMGGLTGWVMAVDPSDREDRRWFEGTLYSDGNAVEEPCTARSIIHNTGAIAFRIVESVRRHVMGLPVPRQWMFTLDSEAPAELVSMG